MNKLVLRNIVYSVVLLAMVILIIIVRTRTPFGRDNSSFSTAPEAEITRIEFRSGREELNLQKENDIWLVNGKYEVRKSAATFITAILTQMRIKSTISDELFREEITSKMIEPVKVKVFEKRRTLSSFLVYRTGSNIYGNIMKLNARSKPFILYLPGNEGDIGSIFTPKELYWRPFTIFSFLPSEISSVMVTNSPDTSSSFTISVNDDKLSLSDGGNIISGWDTSRVRRYLSYYTHVPFETWAFELTEEAQTKIISEAPVCRVTVKKTDGKEVVLDLWSRLKENGETDTDRLWARTGDLDELFIVRYFDIDPILKKRSYFLIK